MEHQFASPSDLRGQGSKIDLGMLKPHRLRQVESRTMSSLRSRGIEAENRLRAASPQRLPHRVAPRVVSGPTVLTGIYFCATCGMAMTLRTGEGGRYRYYTCSIKARQGETGCKGHSTPWKSSSGGSPSPRRSLRNRSSWPLNFASAIDRLVANPVSGST